jgi:hypothetical protein
MTRTRSATGRAVLLVLVAATLLLAMPPGQADAHTRTQETTNLHSSITADPGLPGVRWTVHTGGLLLEVVNEGPDVLIVHGYEGEPYLRIGPDGVDRNRRSPASYLNDARIGRRVSTRTDVAMPRDVDAGAPPEWVRLADEPRARWHDHRLHWMSPAPPRFVDAGTMARAMMRVNLVGVIGRAGGDAGVFQAWEIPLTHGGADAALRGELAWVDPPPAWPWLLAAGLLVLPALLGLRRPTPAAIIRPAAVVVLAVATFNAIHLVDDLIAWPRDPLDELFGLLHTMLFVGTGIGASLWALRVNYGRVLALAIASGALLYHQGLVHLPMLQASAFPTVWPPGAVRLAVALGLLQAMPVAVVVRRARREARAGLPPHVPSSATPSRARTPAGTA